ncbi:MAG: hypothetical protein LBK42_13025 [Propionibacteriaceae bacterium]|jgi:hypothetical protein|nr:hypothetical protein [Propionibacteriaceae bacterium]
MLAFDDGRLDDPALLAARGERLRQLALAGARLRRALVLADLDALARTAADFRPRALIALGPEARLVRAVAEPTCRVPVVAWSRPGLPAWVGPLDLVLTVSAEPDDGSDPAEEALRRDAAAETADGRDPTGQALRRGTVVFAVGAGADPAPHLAAGRSLARVATGTTDAFVNATIALAGLERLGLVPAGQLQPVADGLDAVAQECSPHTPLGSNPAKDMAVCLADTSPLLWGGTVLADRACRRLAETIRQVSRRLALAAEASALVPLLAAATPPDPFADPFLDPAQTISYCLVSLDDASDDPLVRHQRRRLEALAESHGVRVARLVYGQGSALQRYACLLQHGLFAAAFLELGLV